MNTPTRYIGNSNFNFKYVRLCDLDTPREMVELFANSRDPDQMSHSALSDLNLHILPVMLLGVSRLQLVNNSFATLFENKNIKPIYS